MRNTCFTFWFIILSVLANAQTVPDFSHPENPHIMIKNPFALPSQLDQYDYLKHRIGSQPLMLILLEFPNSAHNPSRTGAYFENLIFGPDPSVNGYYKEVSYGNYSFANAGIFGWFVAPNDSKFYFENGNYTKLASDAVQAAISAQVNFSIYDTNGDRKITREELLIQMVFSAHSDPNLPWVMSTRPDQQKHEGVFTQEGLEIDTWAIRGEESGNISLFAHELAHGALALPDLYSDNFGGDPSEYFTLMANIPDNYTPHFSPWAKIHLGWIKPIVVTQSGNYSISAVEQNPLAYVLYNPNHGVNEYFIIENRWPSISIYENGLLDSGLAIWHLTEFYDNDFNFYKGRKMVAMKWAGGDESISSFPFSALWDCSQSVSCYDFTNISNPRNSKWQDGTASGIEIKNISNAGAIMSAYFSVPSVVGISDNLIQSPTEFRLLQNYPNPFNPSTIIRYTIPKQSFVTLKIYNVLGEEIKTLVSKELNIGVYEVNFDASNLASGIYFYSLKAGDSISTKKLILMK